MPSGGQWYHEKGGATGLKRFLKLYAPDILEIGETPQFTAEQAGLAPEAETFQSEPVEQRTAAQDKSSEIAGPQFAAETAQTLLEVAHWWKEKGKRAELVISRPKFRGKSVNSSVRVNGPLANAALEKAREPEYRNRTGGNLSGLVEWLLWQFVDCDPALLAPEQSQEEG